MPVNTPVSTYVLIADGVEDSAQIESWYSAVDHTYVIKPKPHETEADIAARIKPPANLVAFAQETDKDHFQWNKGQYLDYKLLYKSLAAGVSWITLAVCDPTAGVSDEALRAAKPGTLIQTLVAPKSLVTAGHFQSFADESSGDHVATNIFLKALDNFNPAYYQQSVTYQNSLIKVGPKFDTDPAHALTSALYIAGPHPQKIDLNSEMKHLAASNDPKRLEYMKKAVTDVKEKFDVAGATWTGHGYKFRNYNLQNLQFAADTDKLNHTIDQIADKLIHHQAPHMPSSNPGGNNAAFLQQVDEVRIGFALTFAHLNESHTLQDDVDKAKSPAPVAHKR